MARRGGGALPLVAGTEARRRESGGGLAASGRAARLR